MTRRSSEELIARLADALEPVRPVAAPWQGALAVGAAFAASAVAVAACLGLHPIETAARHPISAALAGLLAGVAAAAIAAGLASRIPGRERVALAAAIAASAGGLAAALLALVHAGSGAEPTTLAHALEESVHCAARSLLLAIPSGGVALALASRGAPWRSRASGLAVAAGAVSAGALLVHLSCPSPSAWHWLGAHALLPWLAGLPLGLLAAALIAGLDARSASAGIDGHHDGARAGSPDHPR